MSDRASSPIEEFDVLIVGSGPTGSAYARTVSEQSPNVRMLVVEVGPALPGIRGRSVHNMAPSEQMAARLSTQGPDIGVDRAAEISRLAPCAPAGQFEQTNLPGLFFVDPCPQLAEGELGMPAASMASGVGGMGIHWATLCPRPSGSERIPFIPEPEMDAALDSAERLLQVRKCDHADGLVGAIRKAIAHEFDGDGLSPVGFVPTATRWEAGQLVMSGTDIILGDIEGVCPAFELRTETLARRVLVDTDEAVGAELQDRRTGHIFRVRSSHVVVCADGLRTPQLLFASGIHPDALGRYVNDHFKMASRVVLNEEFDPASYPDMKGAPHPFVPYSDSRPIEGLVIPLALHTAGMQGETLRRLAAMAWYGAKEVQATDRLEFSPTETDFYGMPKMAIRYSLTETDRATVRMMEDCTRRAASRVGSLLGEPRLAPGGSSLHYQGAARMGAVDDGTSVCDSYSQVWGVRRLRLGGNCVIPTRTAANPTLTSVALAWRSAMDLVGELDIRG